MASTAEPESGAGTPGDVSPLTKAEPNGDVPLPPSRLGLPSVAAETEGNGNLDDSQQGKKGPRKTAPSVNFAEQDEHIDAAPPSRHGEGSLNKHQSLSDPLPESSLQIPGEEESVATDHNTQVRRPELNVEQPDYWSSKHISPGADDTDSPNKDRIQALMSKMKAFVSSPGLSNHARTQSGFTVGGSSFGNITPTRRGSEDSQTEDRRYPEHRRRASDADADAEDSEEDVGRAASASKRRRKQSRRPSDGGPQTAPTTPRTPVQHDKHFWHMSPTVSRASENPRSQILRRRATMTDIPEQSRQGVSEDEGRDRLKKPSAWRRGSNWVQNARGQSFGGSKTSGTPEGRRPTNLRRFTGFAGTAEAGETSPAAWRLRGDRTSSVSAQKWRQLKAGLKMIGQRRKEQNKIDYAKSAELMAELAAGTPAALILASMFQRDEHGNKRIPILLEQLKLRITDSKRVDSKSTGDRHVVFRIELEYGSGMTRMKWVIYRALRDFANLHIRYKLQHGADRFKGEDAKRPRLPRFPRTAFPYLKGVRGLEDEIDEEDEDRAEDTAPSAGEVSGPEKSHSRRKKSRPSFSLNRRKSSTAGSQVGEITASVAAAVHNGAPRKDTYAERQRRKLETYLQQMIRYLVFRADSNRLCKFLELSALGVRLAAEGSYHGKEGLMVIRSGSGLDFRKAWKPLLIKKRHSPKWFLVRHSYIVCVDSPEEMNIYDVFLVDSDFSLQTKHHKLKEETTAIANSAKKSTPHPQHHTLKLRNAERKVKLLARNERQLSQFEDSIRFMSSNTLWSQKNRFDSFAPVRQGVFAQWLVDGRDYMWNVSRAISMARDVIYIHDWWLSPELYMRRPAAISQKWRLDRLLQRKAQEGVKVFVIMYRNINSAIPIDSEYSKFSLLDLHANVFVQRSPNQFRQNTFFWAHHEKICIVDHTVAFVGGIDLCFGRWDTPQHPVVDDKLTGFELSDKPKDADHCQLWPGKDYSNPRVQDFYALDKPYEEMYDRTKIPRMPWHDISMQVVGQPARDLTRHFVQRWNYVLRQRKPTRPTPFLLPPPDFNVADLEALGLDGTCEVQILRSACWWSIGTPDRTEHSIMDAYIKSIETSEHFVYIENQFFITSSEVEGTRIENKIGDALVERIIRAHHNNEDWRAVIVIPLMPGFQNTVDSQDGTSVRLIMQCQYRSICRGETSIFGRLKAIGIEPEDWIQFFSLRSWGKIGPNKQLVTEQLYIHAKCMVVDDRVAIIGSANINERSMLGSRDSECAAVVRDTDMLWSTMGGEPYLVGRFPHTLRMRLMREHLGIDVDEVMEEERQEEEDSRNEKWERDMDHFHGHDDGSSIESAASDGETEQKLLFSKHRVQDEIIARSEEMFSFNHDIDWEQANNPNLRNTKRVTEDARVTGNPQHKTDVDGRGFDKMEELMPDYGSGRDSELVRGPKEVLVSNLAPEGKGTLASPSKSESQFSPERSQAKENQGNSNIPPPPGPVRMSTVQMGLPLVSQLPALPDMDDTDIGGPPLHRTSSKHSTEGMHHMANEMRRPVVHKDAMRDPLSESFYLDVWLAVADNNTKLFRQVFRCMPDNEVKGWKEYKEYAAYSERFAQTQGGKSEMRTHQEHPEAKSGPPGQSAVAEKLMTSTAVGAKIGDLGGKAMEKVTSGTSDRALSEGSVQDWAEKVESGEGITSDTARKSSEKRELQQDLDEKAELRATNDSPSGSSTLPTANAESPESEKSQPMQKQPSLTKSETLKQTATTDTEKRRRKRATTKSSKREFHATDDLMDPVQAEELLKMVQGHLVVWPTDWLVKEETGGNWLYSIDQLAPLEIYN